MYVLITVHLGRQLAVPDAASATVPMPPPPVRSVEITGVTWEFLDQVDLGDIFLQRIPVLKQCPRFLRGRVEYTFIQNRFHPMTLSSKHDSTQ